MPKKVIIFIDGQNVYHALRSMSIREIDIDYGKIFKSMLDEDDELIRTYLFRPAKVQSFKFDKNRFAKAILEKPEFIAFKESCQDKDWLSLPTEITEAAEKDYQNSINWFTELKQRFSETDFKYQKIAADYESFQIVRAGMLKVDPYRREILGEKGVDVSLSVKMVEMSLTDKLDKIILFSGDYDHREAVSLCQDKLKKVYIVKIMRGAPPLNISSSGELLMCADKVLNLYESDLRGKFKKS